MANIHAVQTLFLAKQVVPCAVGHEFSTVLSEHHSVYDYVYPSVSALSTKLHTVFIHQTFLPPKFFTILYVMSKHISRFIMVNILIYILGYNLVPVLFSNLNTLLGKVIFTAQPFFVGYDIYIYYIHTCVLLIVKIVKYVHLKFL